MALHVNELIVKEKPQETTSHYTIIKEGRRVTRNDPEVPPNKWYIKRSQYLDDMVSKEK
jgi:hypothetical protein